MSKTVKDVKRQNPNTPRGSGQKKRWLHRVGTYNAGRNASKRKNRRADVRARVKARKEHVAH